MESIFITLAALLPVVNRSTRFVVAAQPRCGPRIDAIAITLGARAR